MLTAKQMLQRLTVAFAQVKAGNTFEKLPNEIKQIICSKEVTIKVYNTRMNSMEL